MLALLLSALLTLTDEYVGVQSAPVVAPVSDTSAMMYLSQFGWLDPSARKPGSAALLDIRNAVKDFQSFAGLNQTGELDDETLQLMNMPRCGVRDKIGHDARRKKRYALQGSRWKVRDLSYRITKYPRGLKTADVDREISQAFQIWENVANISFHRVDTVGSKVHIEIRFEKGEHGDGDAFDGEGGTLAHAYFPVYGGDAHFDEEEKWTIESYRGTNLFQVAAHEFGHSLGLSHSDVRSSLMAPFYRGYHPSFKLDSDDTNAIQALYGKRIKSVPVTTTKRPIIGAGNFPKKETPSTPTDKSKLCDDPKIDAIAHMADGFTYVFKGSDFYRLTENGVADGYPKKIRTMFGTLEDNLDAAFTWTNDRTYFFKGNKYWRFTDMTMDTGYPKDISDGFEGIPANIDTAFVWSGNGKIYFFKGDKYWRFDPSRRPPVSSGYPKPISNWEGVPNNLDAALRYSNGHTYFFRANKYWRFNDRNFAVDTTDPPFPRNTAQWWFGCGGGASSMKNVPDDYQGDKSDDAAHARPASPQQDTQL
ncbi:unnamed protein product [Allacma fusca]|uniref:Peptidase metallopeptidase domain-containing protein n=1 Tax=Allacma fusca TaxID=39272 RepID=A0A8J2KL98_9HEXA|nr:unnamed protein product [Allacma fusca]